LSVAASTSNNSNNGRTTASVRGAFWGQQFYSRLVFYGRFMNAALRLSYDGESEPVYPTAQGEIGRKRDRKGEGK